MKKISKILSAISATVLCTASFAGTVSNAATSEKYNTYAVYCDVDSGSGVMWADVTFNYDNINMDEMEVETGNFGGNATYTTLTKDNGETIYSASFRADGAIMAPGILFKSKFWTTDKMTLSKNSIIKTSAFDASRKFIGNDIVDASFVLVGDANEDGSVDIADEAAVFQSLGNPTKYKLTKKGNYAADVNFDGVVNNADMELIKDYNNGVINWF